MKKIYLIMTVSLFITACGETDKYKDLRELTVQDYLNNKELLNEVLEKCSNAEIKDDEICQVTKKAVHQNFDWR